MLFSILAASVSITAAYADVTAIPAGNVVNVPLTCDEASKEFPDVAAGKLPPDRIIGVMAKINQCGAAGYNDAQDALGATDRAVPTAHVEQTADGKKTVVFNLVVLDPNDEKSLRQVCSAGASVVGVATGDPLLASVISSAGNYSCGSYLKALMRSDNLLIFAPELIPGIDITEDLLRRAGIPEAKIKQSEAALRKVSGDAAVGGVQIGVVTATGGIVTVDKQLRCVKIFGKRVCR